MRKITLSFFFALLLLLSLFSCSPIIKDNQDPGEAKDEFTVCFDANGGTGAPESVKVKLGEKIPYQIPPQKVGYEFTHWSYMGEKWTLYKNAVSDDMTLVANFTPINYSITYELNGGILPTEYKDIYTIEDDDYLLPTPTLGELKFDGWFSDGEIVEVIRAGSVGDISLSAIFYTEKLQPLPDTNGNIPEINVYSITSKDEIKIKAIGAKDVEVHTKIDIPHDWIYLKIDNGSSYNYILSKDQGDKKVMDVKINSGENSITITPVTKLGEEKLTTEFGITLSDGTVVDKNYFPGFVRKTVSFTLDDGIYQHDKRVVEILKPHGFTGTFNINNPSTVSDPSIYDGFEVANHHLLHTTAMREGFDYSGFTFADQPLPPTEEQDKNVIYKNYAYKNEKGEWIEGFYYVHYSIYGSTAGWHPLASDETYINYLEKTTEELERIFGEGSIVGFAYPHGGAANAAIREHIKESGYLYARSTGNLKDKTGFALPEDRFKWTYNADHNCLLSVMAAFDAFADDGQLKMFAFGVHAKDFETYGKWEDLQTYAELYGDRNEDFWYATNRQIFEYQDAVNALKINDDALVNESDIDLFVTVNGERVIVFAHSTYDLH